MLSHCHLRAQAAAAELCEGAGLDRAVHLDGSFLQVWTRFPAISVNFSTTNYQCMRDFNDQIWWQKNRLSERTTPHLPLRWRNSDGCLRLAVQPALPPDVQPTPPSPGQASANSAVRRIHSAARVGSVLHLAFINSVLTSGKLRCTRSRGCIETNFRIRRINSPGNFDICKLHMYTTLICTQVWSAPNATIQPNFVKSFCHFPTIEQ